jgi:hypothetical protein
MENPQEISKPHSKNTHEVSFTKQTQNVPENNQCSHSKLILKNIACYNFFPFLST